MTSSVQPNETHSFTRNSSHFPPNIFIGTSGWAYPTWKPAFYPAGTSPKRFLEHYASRLNSVEVNYTFRSLPASNIVNSWLGATSGQFRFSFKAPQRITHFSRLKSCAVSVEEFVGALNAVRSAGKLGLLLFQLPPNFKADPGLLEEFLCAPAFMVQDGPRVAFEFRHTSWFADEIYRILQAHNSAMCIAETEDLSTPEVHCASDFTCFRLRRPGGYQPAELSSLAARFLQLAQTRAVYAYFKHEDEPTGALNAVSLVSEIAARAGNR